MTITKVDSEIWLTLEIQVFTLTDIFDPNETDERSHMYLVTRLLNCAVRKFVQIVQPVQSYTHYTPVLHCVITIKHTHILVSTSPA